MRRGGRPPRYFSLEEANRLLPWLLDQFEAMASLRERIAEREGEVEGLARQGRQNGGSEIESRLKEQREIIDAMTADLRQGPDKIIAEGILLRDSRRGLVDFLSMRDDQEVYLCWCWAEDGEQVSHWHPTDASFGARQPL